MAVSILTCFLLLTVSLVDALFHDVNDDHSHSEFLKGDLPDSEAPAYFRRHPTSVLTCLQDENLMVNFNNFGQFMEGDDNYQGCFEKCILDRYEIIPENKNSKGVSMRNSAKLLELVGAQALGQFSEQVVQTCSDIALAIGQGCEMAKVIINCLRALDYEEKTKDIFEKTMDEMSKMDFDKVTFPETTFHLHKLKE